MKQIDVKELVDLMLGNIEWHGESNHDSKVVERLDDYEKLLNHVLDNFFDLVKVRHQYQHSAKECGNKAYEILKDINKRIEEYLHEYRDKYVEGIPF